MIARFHILLPYDIFIAGDEGWFTVDGAVAVNGADSGYQFRFYPPGLCSQRPESTGSVHEHALLWTTKLNPPTFSESLLLDGKRVSRVNVLVIDFIKPEFDRTRGAQGAGDPPPELAFELANRILARLRAYSRAAYIKPLVFKRDPWHLRYLTDKFEDFEKEEGKLRSKTAGQVTVGEAALTPETMQIFAERWNAAEPYVWDELLLDAHGLWPDIGSSIVIAFAALETYIEWALGALQEEHRKFPEKFWRWIKERDHWAKQPSVAEQFDALLFAFAGRSLKDDPSLWTAFTALKKARNNIVHEGSATLDGQKVDAARAKDLIDGVDKIVAWVEQLLPEAKRRWRAAAPGIYSRRLATPEEAASFGPAALAVGKFGLLEPGGPGIRVELRKPEPADGPEAGSPR
jgi:hypothetical protein